MIDSSKKKVLNLPGNIELILTQIPAGYFRLGEDNALVATDAYYIGVYPVTVKQYQCFVTAEGYSESRYWSRTGWRWRENHDVKHPKDTTTSESFSKHNHPQVGVSWYEAHAYCTWLSQYTGKPVTLPNEMEWEKAARGKNGHKYPWGETPPTDIHCNFDNGKGHTTPVGIYPAGKSFFGCYDMAGNVWEWCKNTEGPLPYRNVKEREDPRTRSLVTMRGGAWSSTRQDLLSWHRGFNFPLVRLSTLGFRVALKTLHARQ